jgi:hypothetical protein
MYFKKYSLLYWKILKNGTNVFRDLLNDCLGETGYDLPSFTKINDTSFVIPNQPNDKLIVVWNQFAIVRNPYDRLVSQFYQSKFIQNRYGWNAYELHRAMYELKHYEMFQYWVKETYKDGGKGITDNHFLSQTDLIEYKKNNTIKLFKLEELEYHKLFWFMDLTDEQKAEIDRKGDEWKKVHSSYGHHSKGYIRQGEWERYYDKNTIQICNEYFAKDFENFGYDMINSESFKRIVI